MSVQLTSRSRAHSYVSLAGLEDSKDGLVEPAGSSGDACMLVEILRDEAEPLPTPALIESVEMRRDMWAKAHDAVMATGSGGLTVDDVQLVRRWLFKEVGMEEVAKDLERGRTLADCTEPSLAFFYNIYHSPVPPFLTSDDARYACLRQMARAATDEEIFRRSTIPKDRVDKWMGPEAFSARAYFCSQGIQERPKFTCSYLPRSDILLGQGPNGGHMGTLAENLLPLAHSRDVGLGMFSARESQRHRHEGDQFKRATTHLQELWLAGNDINKVCVRAAFIHNQFPPCPPFLLPQTYSPPTHPIRSAHTTCARHNADILSLPFLFSLAHITAPSPLSSSVFAWALPLHVTFPVRVP